MNNKLKTQAVEQLFQAILSLKEHTISLRMYVQLTRFYPCHRDLRLPRC